MYNGSALLLFTRNLHCLETFEHMSANWTIKVYMFVKFHLQICNSVVYMLAVLGPSLKVISITGVLLYYAKVSPLYNVL